VEMASRRVMIVLIWVGLVPLGQVLAQAPSGPAPMAASGPEFLPAGPAETPPGPAPNQPGWIVGQQPPAAGDAVFGNLSPPGCEICGCGSCEPAPWYVDLGARVLARSVAGPELGLTTAFASSSTPQHQAIVPQWVATGTTTTTTAGTTTTNTIYTWSNYRTESLVASVPGDGYESSPAFVGTIGTWLGLGPEGRDHFLEFTYSGHDSWRSGEIVTGVLQPDYFVLPPGGVVGTAGQTTYIEQGVGGPTSSQQTPPIMDYSGSLRSPFPLSSELAGAPTALQNALNTSFNLTLRQSFLYTSSLDEFELNYRLRPRDNADRLVLDPDGRWRRECTPGGHFSFLLGLRSMVLDERLKFQAQGSTVDFLYDDIINSSGQDTGVPKLQTVPNPDPTQPAVQGYIMTGAAPAFPTGGTVRVQAHNDLFGLQLGGDWAYHVCGWEWGVRGKIAPCVNFANQKTEIATLATPAVGPYPGTDAFDFFTTGRNNGLSVIAECGFFSTYHLRPNLCVNAGFDFRWIEGIATAPGNFPSGTFGVGPPLASYINTSGVSIVFGPTLGLEYDW